MLADFTITIHSDPPRKVQVKVHDDVMSLRSATTQYARRWNTRKKARQATHKDTLGICHRFNLQKKNGKRDPLCALVRLAPPNLGVGIVSHELAHAAVWIWEMDNQFEVPLTCANDEQFCWILGELVRQTLNKFNDLRVYDRVP